MKRVATAVLATALLCLPACSSGSSSEGAGSSVAPEDLITVRVTNTSGDMISVSYTFSQMGAAHLGTVPRGGENVEFRFPWEPGRMQFLVEAPRGRLSSNGLSARRGDTFTLQVSRREARATRVDPSG